ncbi:WD40 repeat domain-containing protein [Granulicella sp. WH15]|uniref:WD40 repeat domain-containing protein n=1 Tax=Granulicella sp. WH15 TaxID=2602070 RepID=UPI0013A59CE0|nr:WD40 repeat domain-containing protein [Granulicella sp. WH15]
MNESSLPSAVCTLNRFARVAIACITIFGAVTRFAPAQEHPAATSTPLASAAYVHYLLALRFASDGIKYEALREAAASLRVQREGNPAAGLAFQLIAEQRQDVHVRLCCMTANIILARYNTDGSRVLIVLDDKTASIWDAHTGKRIAGPMRHEGDVLAAAWSADGRRVVTSSRDAAVQLWDAATGQLLHARFHTEKPLSHIALSPDGQRVLGSMEGEVYLLDAATGAALATKLRYHDDVNVVMFSNDGEHAFVGTNDDSADLLDPMTGKRLHRLSLGNAIFSAMFSQDSRLVLIGSEDHTAKIWDTNTGVQQGSSFTHTGPVSDAVFSPDGKRVLTTSYDHTARVWDARTGKALTPLLQHSAPLIDGGFSADASLVFTHGRDQSIRVWSATTGEAMMLPLHYTSNISDAVFSPTDPSLLVAIGNSAEVLDMPPSDLAPVWLADLAEFAASRSRFSQITPPGPSRIEKLQADLLASHVDDPWTRFGRWYFSASSQRGVSPWSKLSMQQYVDQLLGLNTPESLSYARQIAFDHPAWMVKIDAAQKALAAEKGRDVR